MADDGCALSHLMIALSAATELAMGQPAEFALTSCLLAVRLAEEMGLPEPVRRDVYYQALLRYIGCNAESYVLAAVVGDEIAFRQRLAPVDMGAPPAVLATIIASIRAAHAGAGPVATARAVARGLLQVPALTPMLEGHCEVAARLAARMGFGEPLVASVGHLYARWDGRGIPPARGEAIPLPARLVTVAQDALLFFQLGGVDAALDVVRRRRGSAYDPAAADALCRAGRALIPDAVARASWSAAVDAEPGGPTRLDAAALDAACAAIADLVDLKSPCTLGHSPAVAALAADAAAACALPARDVALVRRAGWLHDVGRVGVSTAIWMKPGPLTDMERERVRSHPYHTARILDRPGLREIGAVASMHCERLDGSGYHRGLDATSIPLAARVLAAADAWRAMAEPRPHRAALAPNAIAAALRGAARAGRLDARAVDAVVAAAGGSHASPRGSRAAAPPGALTPREVEVLRLVARGRSIADAARALGVAPKTVDAHLQHVYAKAGVRTRAGATLYAVEHGLLDPAPPG